jgi:type I site-specific restriction endonuclease
MSDKEVFEAINKIVGTHVSSLTLLLTQETQDIRHSVDQLTERVKRQNGSVRDLNEWKSKCEGEKEANKDIKKTALEIRSEKRAATQKTLQMIATVIMAIGLCITAYFSFFGSKQSKANSVEIQLTNKKVDELGTPVVTNPRGVMVPLPDSVKVRFYPKEFLNDTIK